MQTALLQIRCRVGAGGAKADAIAKPGRSGDIAIEPFDYPPKGSEPAAHAIGYVRGILETLQSS